MCLFDLLALLLNLERFIIAFLKFYLDEAFPFLSWLLPSLEHDYLVLPESFFHMFQTLH